MNWEAISAIADIIGVIAIVVSLIYVSIQIRQNTKVARAATRQAIADSTESLGNDLLNSAEMAEIFVKHMNGVIGCDSVYGKGSTFWFEIPTCKNI